MKNMELLAPAGNMESLKAAVYNGANAVYLGIKQFNARNNIDGFTLETLPEAVDFAHLYDVRVYLALNILFKDDELQSALDVVAEANNIGIDAFIVQDLGLAYLIKKHYPSVELHASTQMAIHNLEGVRVLERLGFSRVVLARETSPEEIKRISDNSDIEIEFFVQGALCVSFSGNCYMCSHLVNKSGNRGVCQQFCRLPYTFENGKVSKYGFLLSAKDICMLDRLNQLKDLGVCSLKIEGRARRPYYVAQACKMYRNALDGIKNPKEEVDALKVAFNRGYTPAYFDGNANIISQIQGNNGLKIGVVKSVKNGLKFNEIFISSNYQNLGKCGLKFLYQNEEIASIGVHDIKPTNDGYRITTTARVKTGSEAYLIQDENYEQKLLNNIKKLPIEISFFATPNQPIKITAKYKDLIAEQYGEIATEAKTISVSNEQVLKQLSRSDMFDIVKFDCIVEGCYILNSTINKLRNNIYNNLKQKILNKYLKNKLNKIKIDIKYNAINKQTVRNFNYSIINNVNNLDKSNNIIFNYKIFDLNDILKFDQYCNANGVNGYIDIPNFATEQDINCIKLALEKTDLGVVANNLYALNFDCKMIGGQYLNVYNNYTILALQNLHNLDAIFVEEMTDKTIKNLHADLPILKREKSYMTLLHCPFKQNLNCDCKNCKFSDCSTLKINSGKKFKIERKKTVSCVFYLKDIL